MIIINIFEVPTYWYDYYLYFISRIYTLRTSLYVTEKITNNYKYIYKQQLLYIM